MKYTEGISDKGKLENMKHAHVFMRFPGGRAKAVTFSFDDGVVQDAWLVQKLQKYYLKGTFNINAGLCTYDPVDCERLDASFFPDKSIQRRLTRRELCRVFDGSGMEIAAHGYTHAQLNKIDPAAAMWEVCRDRAELEALTGAPVRGFAYPQGAGDDRSAELLCRCGFLYGRLAQSSHSFDVPKNPYLFQPTCHFLEKSAPDLARDFLERNVTAGVWQRDTEPMLLYLWGHGYEMRGEGDFAQTEALLQRLSGHEDVWYPTNLELFSYMRAFDALVYGIDRTFAQNMSCMPVWVYANGKITKIDPGAVVSL